MVTELKNPGFEGITRPGGYNKATPQMDVPEGWEHWSLGDEPEMNVIGRVAPFLKPPRLMDSGNWATKIFKSFGKLNCGLKQVVSGLTPGKQYEFGLWAHAWSAHQTEGLHKDGPGGWDAAWSAGVGYGTTPIPCGEIPALNGNAMNDAIGNVTFWCFVKIDGVTVDGDCIAIYNAYSPVTPICFVAPESGVAEVGFGIQTLWRFNTGDGYFDNAYLVEVGEPEPPEPCKGLPRVQYERTYVLYPPNTSLDEKHMLLDKYPDSTLGPSADDAGQGDLDVRNVIAYNPSGWPGDLKAFLDEWYPGVNYSEVGGEPVPPGDDFLLSQRDPRWADEKIAGSGCSKTIGAMGCWIACCAMSQRYLGIDKVATPSTANKLLGVDGFSGCSTNWVAMNRLGLECVRRESSAEVVRDWIADANGVAFVRVWLPGEHWLFVYDYDAAQGDFRVADPWKNTTGYLKELYPAGPWENGETPPWRLVRKLQVTPPPPPVKPRNLISFQQQQARDYRDEFIAAVQPPAWLLIGGFEEARYLKSLAPNMKIALRHVDNAWGQYVWADDKAKAAEKWVAHYGQTLFDMADSIDYILGLNEYIATNDYAALEATPFWIEALVNRMEKLGWPARLICINPGVGNPQTNVICDEQGIKRQVPILIPAVRLLADTESLVGYHSYWGARKLSNGSYYCTLDDSKDYWYSMRALLDWDPVFTAAGVYPHYAFTEGGPIYVNEQGAMVSSGAGWRYKDTYDGNVNAAIASVLKFNQMCNDWNVTHGDRLEWLAMFLHGGFDDWKWFDWKGEPSRLLGEALKAL